MAERYVGFGEQPSLTPICISTHSNQNLSARFKVLLVLSLDISIRIRLLITKGPNYRFSNRIDLNNTRKEITVVLHVEQTG